ncbi:NB-ARC domains-containing protein [Artemisia annua]|uniref:NB-ARC domains-containing protein n=1 Tax=Artemisia annua TaxID=35608 RepID=A0A2U1P3K3_ARTAN|nr:NB-ARC domains-containing protein [Artemisia annua]
MESFIGGKMLDMAATKLVDVIIEVIAKTCYFKSTLTEIKESLESMRPIFNDMEKLNKELGRRKDETNKFIDLIKGAEELIRQCENVKFWKIYFHAKKLDELNKSLSKFIKVDLQLPIGRDVRETLVKVIGLEKIIHQRGSSSGWSSGAPLLNGVVIGFDDQVNKLKRLVLEDSISDDCSVVVVSAPGGCGKTTLVTMLCHDSEIQGKFGRNIYFVTISSRTPDLKVVVRKLLQKNHEGLQLDFSSDEDAIHQWGSFLNENKSEVLLVLDDVWSDSVVMSLKFKLPGYKILVTSRTKFSQFTPYELKLLDHQQAVELFRVYSFSENESEKNDARNDLVEKLATCCKNHPLALKVIGGSLKGKPVTRWQKWFSELSKRKQSVWSLHEHILHCLEKTLHQFKDEPKIKECYMDLGSFPEDQKIAATALMDMWVQLYEHDEEGLTTQDILSELSNRNLATLLPVRQHVPTTIYDWEDESVMQHDMLRTLAIQLSSKEPVELRERLILNPGEPDLPQVPETVNARLLSISTDERNSLIWNNIQVPRVEVFVCNFLTKTHPLPQFMHRMDKLKVLIITNYGYRFSDLENFPAAQHLSCLTTIRLDHISISSIITSILELENLQKLSLIMCKIGDSFSGCTDGIPNKLPSLMELHIDSCDDLVTFPVKLCNLLLLRKLCITNCHELTLLSEDFGNFPNLDVLRLASCSNLVELPKTIRNLQKLRIIDISDCINLSELPVEFGELGSLQTIYMRGCTGLHELPSAVKGPLEVVCDSETSLLWNNIPNVKLQLVEEDKVSNFMRIISFN